jgi:phosphotransferase system HPr (HPr) family protein
MGMQAAQAAQFEFECRLPNGLHARPASHLAEVANRFVAACALTNRRTGAEADIKSVLAAIATDVRQGDACVLRVEGADQAVAMEALQRFISEELPACDEPVAEAVPESAVPKLPRGLESSGAHYLFGLPVSHGIGRGKAVVLGRIALTADFAGVPTDGPGPEHDRIERGFGAVRARVERLLAGNASGAEAAILKAHLAILGDVTLHREIAQRIDRGRSAARAIVESGERFSSLLQQADNPYIRERAVDVQELCSELLEEIYGADFKPAAIELTQPSILAAETLAPHQLLALERRWLEGIVLEGAGATSHAVILARSMGIPVVVGVAGAKRSLTLGEETIVDGERGLVFPRCPAAVLRFYDRERSAARRRQTVLAQFASAPAVTATGESIEVGANISSAADAITAFANGADGVGLFRPSYSLRGAIPRQRRTNSSQSTPPPRARRTDAR